MGQSNVIPIGPLRQECYLCGDTTDYKIVRECLRCKKTFCSEHSSNIDPNHCVNCLHDATIVEDTFQRVTEEYDEDTDAIVTIKSPLARRIKLTGPDWAFLTEKINKQTDSDLRTTLQFYKAAVSLMEVELTTRTIKKMTHTVMPITDANGNVSYKKVVDTTVRKVTKVKKPVDLVELLEKMKKMGLSPEQIKTMLG
jgi:hypothetical protein